MNIQCVFRGGCMSATTCIEHCRAREFQMSEKPAIPPSSNQRLVEMAEYMEACALIARNGADIHNGSKELREHADMVTAIASYLSSAAETPAEHDAVFEDMETAAHAFFNTGQHAVAGASHVQAVRQFAKWLDDGAPGYLRRAPKTPDVGFDANGSPV